MTDAKDNKIDLGSNIGDAPAAVVKKKKPAAKKAAVGMPSTIKIILEENDDIPPTGLFVGHNGRGYLIRAGEPVDVPVHVIGILDAAVMSTPTVDPTTQQVIGYRERMRYPYRKLG